MPSLQIRTTHNNTLLQLHQHKHTTTCHGFGALLFEWGWVTSQLAGSDSGYMGDTIGRVCVETVVGSFHLDTLKSTPFKTNKVDAENFTSILTGFNLFKPTRIKPPSATLLDNYLYKLSNHSKSGILNK